MKPMTGEWVAKAEGDYDVLERESRARKNPNYDGICFHAQQCAEKNVKAFLYEADIPFPKTHYLLGLLNLALPLRPDWTIFREDMALLSNFAVAFRYPGESSTRDTAKEARIRCRRFRLAAREALGLSNE